MILYIKLYKCIKYSIVVYLSILYIKVYNIN